MIESLQDKDLVALGTLLGVIVTAGATIVLAWVTRVLARETARMADLGSRPQVVAVLEPNRWSMSHFDLNVSNTGTATAFDIKIVFDPPLENGKGRERLKVTPFRSISVLQPQSKLSSYLTDFDAIKGRAYTVTISWLRQPDAKQREQITYTLDIADRDGVSQLGEDDPLVQIAGDLRKMGEDARVRALSSRRLKVDIHTSSDRLRERRNALRERRAWNSKHKPSPSNPPKPDDPPPP